MYFCQSLQQKGFCIACICQFLHFDRSCDSLYCEPLEGKKDVLLKQRRYKEDYRLEQYVDERGREKRRAVYRGNWYAYADAKEAKNALVFALACFLGAAACWLLYMARSTPSTRCMYVLPVASCAVFPMAYWLMGLHGMSKKTDKMTRVQKENGVGRVLRSAVGSMVLLAMACVGDVIFMAAAKNFATEMSGFAMLVIAAAASAACFMRVRDVYNHMTEKKG